MDLDRIRRAEAKERARQTRKAAPGDPTAFVQALANATGPAPSPAVDEHEPLTGLLGTIDDAAERFAREQSPESLIAYKLSVRAFLEAFLARAHTRHAIERLDPAARGDYVLLTRNVDAKLEELSRLFVTQEADQLQLLAVMDEIRGIVVDLMG